MDISDIVNKSHKRIYKTRDLMKTDDIQGCRPKSIGFNRTTIIEHFTDDQKKKKIIKEYDPLDPI